MSDDDGTPVTSTGDPVTVARLSESYRFDNELAAILTRFQYRDDGITLTSNQTRPVPPLAADAATSGLDTVFNSGSSLVFVTYDARGACMVNPIEQALITAIAAVINRQHAPNSPRTDGGNGRALAESPAATDSQAQEVAGANSQETPSLGVVTPHNAQRGALEAVLPADSTANTVEKYQGGERDIIAVSATVSDPEFARHEDEFILNTNRLLVAISRSRLLTIVVCSTALFEVAPADSEQLDNGPVWARLFTQAVGRKTAPAWTGTLGEFTSDDGAEHADVPVGVYPSTVDTDGGEH
jgi:hypothetical protein